MIKASRLRLHLVVLILVGGLAPKAGAGELVLDMAQVGPVDCGETFVLAGRTCTAVPLHEVQCIADDYHGLLLMCWALLDVDLSDLTDIVRITALAETIDGTENSTILGIYRGDERVMFVTNSLVNDPEYLVLETAGKSFDSLRLSGLLLLLHEIRIETDGVPVAGATWSAVKAAYR